MFRHRLLAPRTATTITHSTAALCGGAAIIIKVKIIIEVSKVAPKRGNTIVVLFFPRGGALTIDFDLYDFGLCIRRVLSSQRLAIRG